MIHHAVAQIGGKSVDRVNLTAGNMAVTVLSFGAITQSWRIADCPVILGYDDPAVYAHDPYHMGVIAGRVANRIAGGRFMLDGTEVILPCNDGPNHLHGGPEGLGKQHWQAETDSVANAVHLSHDSPDGAGGYPGRARFQVVVTLTDTYLRYDMRAEVDRPTPVALAQHNYYTLARAARDHRLHIAADTFLPTDETGIPTGERRPVSGTKFDFRQATKVGDMDKEGTGIDNCMVLTGHTPAATLTAPGAPTLAFYSDQPGLHLYTGANLGAPFKPFAALCLEPEALPDAVNHDDFPSVIATPDRPYRQILTIEVA